jgi:hypothetical protein
MAKWTPCKRRDFIKKLQRIGFAPPEPGVQSFLHALWNVYVYSARQPGIFGTAAQVTP